MGEGTNTLIGFIGAGNMARSLAGGLLQRGWAKSALALADPDVRARAALYDAFGIQADADNGTVAQRADVLVLAVKPQALAAVCRALAPTVQQRRPLIVSIAAGIRAGDIARWLGGDIAVVRAMPNTPALVGAGCSGLYANAHASAAQRAQAEVLLRAVGVTVWLHDEDLIDAVTALSGSGPAYFFRFMEALEEAAVEAGLAAADARTLTLHTAFGAAKMALEAGEAPAVLRARVTSPGGTTARALKVLDDGAFAALIHQALFAATTRARELADQYGKD